MGKPEGKVEDYLVSRCDQLGWIQFKFTAPGRRGVPDRLIIGNGVTAFMELKSDVGKPSEIQKVVIGKMRDAGAIVYICHTKAEVDEALAGIAAQGRRKKRHKKSMDVPGSIDFPEQPCYNTKERAQPRKKGK